MRLAPGSRSNSSTNCGACGVTCTGGQVCANGQCGCPSPTTACNGGCVDMTVDRNDCGGCNKACGADQICVNSTCVNTGPIDAGAPDVNIPDVNVPDH